MDRHPTGRLDATNVGLLQALDREKGRPDHGSACVNVGVELVGSGPRCIDLGLSLLCREAGLLGRQVLPAGAGSKLVCLGGTPVGFDLGDIGEVSMLPCLASQVVAVLGLAAAHYVDHCGHGHEDGHDRGDDSERHWQPPWLEQLTHVMRYQGPEQRSRESAGTNGRVQHGAGMQSVSSTSVHPCLNTPVGPRVGA